MYRFQNRFDEILRSAENYPVNLPILVKDVKESLKSSNVNWRKLMTSVRFYLPVESSEENQENDAEVRECPDNSMIRILLMNKELQREIFEILFGELRDRTAGANESQLQEFSLIIRQMQFVDFVDHSEYLFQEYFSILPLCKIPKTREIMIGAVDDFVVSAKHSVAVEKILEIVTDTDELFSAGNLGTFGRLCLRTSILKNIRVKIVNYIKNGAPKSILYNLLTFMARFNRVKDEEDETVTYYEVINDIRECVKWDMEESEAKHKIYGLINRSVNRCPVTRDNWVKALKYVTNARNHKIIDPLVCFMIAMNENERANMESLFKKRVKERLFTVELLQCMARNTSTILLDLVPIMTDFFRACFCDRDKYTALFGAIGYRILFKIKNGDRRYPLQSLISLACIRPNDAPFQSDNDTRTNALELLLEIKKRLKSEADGGFFQVEKILDRSTYLNIDQYRIVIKILCSLAYDGQGVESIKTDLEIMAQKNVTFMNLP